MSFCKIKSGRPLNAFSICKRNLAFKQAKSRFLLCYLILQDLLFTLLKIHLGAGTA